MDTEHHDNPTIIEKLASKLQLLISSCVLHIFLRFIIEPNETVEKPRIQPAILLVSSIFSDFHFVSATFAQLQKQFARESPVQG